MDLDDNENVLTDGDYNEYLDDEEATVISGASKASTIQDHLTNLDSGIPAEDDRDEDDDEDEILPLPPAEENFEEEEGNYNINDDSDDEDDTPYFSEVVTFTVDEVLELGLDHIGYTAKRINRAKYATNIERFKAHYGSIPKVLCDIWEDLQTTEHSRAWVPPAKWQIHHFLMAMHFLKRYLTEFERECIFDMSIKVLWRWTWYFVYKIQHLKYDKIVWPDNFGDDIWIMSVDGMHCWLEEPQHPMWSQDTKYFSHKYHAAGMNYELGIHLVESRLIWMNGPFLAGGNDVKVFNEQGLKEKLKSLGKKAIGDLGYIGHYDEITIQSPHDSKEVDRFKSRALKRHERFNGYTKAFSCLSGRFRHSTHRFKNCFEAVCVICQYQMESGYDLFDISLKKWTTTSKCFMEYIL